MVEVYNNQHLWNNRQMPKVHDTFVDIWGTDKLWVTIDRANLNFPIREGFEYKSFIHWDYDPDTKPVNVQGVLALSDQMDENMGGFQCIPWLFRNYYRWRMTQPADRNKFRPDISGLEDKIVKVGLEAGDLVIWDSRQPHGIRGNYSNGTVRIAQYISMMPAEEDNDSLREWRINSWRDQFRKVFTRIEEMVIFYLKKTRSNILLDLASFIIILSVKIVFHSAYSKQWQI